FARAGHRDGEVSAWRNIGIARALDLGDQAGALDAFQAALTLARTSSNQRGEVQSLLYRGETLRRMGRTSEAAGELHSALAGATRVGVVGEQGKAARARGRVGEAEGRAGEAGRLYEQALAAIESVRAEVQAIPLRAEFLADKRDVYDALIALRLAAPSTSAAEVFALVEQSRARTWQDRLPPGAQRVSLAEVQPAIAPGALLLEYWSGPTAS